MTSRQVTPEIDAPRDQLAREHKRLTSEVAMPELPNPRWRGRTYMLLIGAC
jgi:hypothetical protein